MLFKLEIESSPTATITTTYPMSSMTKLGDGSTLIKFTGHP